MAEEYVYITPNKAPKNEDVLAIRAYLGHADAQLELGKQFLFGNGTEQSLEKAVSWLQKAAAQGNEEAKALLTKAQDDLAAKTQDIISKALALEKDAALIKKDADQGNAEAQALYAQVKNTLRMMQRYVGDCFANGTGVAQSKETAQAWYRKAEETQNS